MGCWGLEAIRVPLLVVRFQGAGGLGFKIDRGVRGYVYLSNVAQGVPENERPADDTGSAYPTHRFRSNLEHPNGTFSPLLSLVCVEP